jgi:hypothetical protein
VARRLGPRPRRARTSSGRRGEGERGLDTSAALYRYNSYDCTSRKDSYRF